MGRMSWLPTFFSLCFTTKEIHLALHTTMLNCILSQTVTLSFFCQIFGIWPHYKDKWPVCQMSKSLKLRSSQTCQDKKKKKKKISLIQWIHLLLSKNPDWYLSFQESWTFGDLSNVPFIFLSPILSSKWPNTWVRDPPCLADQFSNRKYPILTVLLHFPPTKSAQMRKKRLPREAQRLSWLSDLA